MAAQLTLRKERRRMADDEHRTDERKGEPTPFELFENFVKRIALVSKEELEKERAEYEQ
jgi:hypothetical protein